MADADGCTGGFGDGSCVGWLQAALGIPRTVGLDLSADRMDMGQPLPALLVAEVDSLAAPELNFDQNQTRYLCLSSDNR